MDCLLKCPLCYELEMTEDEDLPFRSQVCYDCSYQTIKVEEVMKKWVTCYQCHGAGFVNNAVGFGTHTCPTCHALGKRFEYSGEFAKEERKQDEQDLKESLGARRETEYEYFEFKKYRRHT